MMERDETLFETLVFYYTLICLKPSITSFIKFDRILKGAYVRCEASGTLHLHFGLL